MHPQRLNKRLAFYWCSQYFDRTLEQDFRLSRISLQFSKRSRKTHWKYNACKIIQLFVVFFSPCTLGVQFLSQVQRITGISSCIFGKKNHIREHPRKSYVILLGDHAKCLRLMTSGGRGVKKSPKHAYVIHGCSLIQTVVRTLKPELHC